MPSNAVQPESVVNDAYADLDVRIRCHRFLRPEYRVCNRVLAEVEIADRPYLTLEERISFTGFPDPVDREMQVSTSRPHIEMKADYRIQYQRAPIKCKCGLEKVLKSQKVALVLELKVKDGTTGKVDIGTDEF